MKYDDASWHYGGKFPKDLPDHAGATHIGMFLAWMIIGQFESEQLAEEFGELLDTLRARGLTGAELLMSALDGKFSDQDLNKVGNAFALAYYQGKDDDSIYIDDYFEIFEVNEDTCYRVEDTWANFDRLAVRIAERMNGWKALGCPEFLMK